MIAYLKGNVLKKTEKGIILNTGNVGYLVKLSAISLEEINENDKVELFINSVIREDTFDLYGFKDEQELEFFRNLISVNGVGPRTATDIMDVALAKVKGAIINEDHGFLSKIKGIGPKTAKRIVLELKGKIENEDFDREYQGLNQSTNSEAQEALTRLGYQKHQISKILNDLPKEITETEEIITYFLKHN